MGIYYIEGWIENTETIINICNEKNIDPKKTVFLFPGNKSHHDDKSSLFSIKSGAGLAKIAGEWGHAGYPTLSLPTTNMEDYETNKLTENTVVQALDDLWEAKRNGYNIILPVRKQSDNSYFPASLSGCTNADKDEFEPCFWGENQTEQNLPLATRYLEELNKLHDSYTSKNTLLYTTEPEKLLIRLLNELYGKMNGYQYFPKDKLILYYCLYSYLSDKLSKKINQDVSLKNKTDELNIIFNLQTTEQKMFKDDNFSSFYDYYSVIGAEVTDKDIEQAHLSIDKDNIESLMKFIRLYTIRFLSLRDGMSTENFGFKEDIDDVVNQFVHDYYGYEVIKTQSMDNKKSSISMDNKKSSISMQILGGFVAVLGVAAVAVAILVLHAAAINVVGLTIACIGGAALVAGCGIFAKAYQNTSNSTSGDYNTLQV